MQPANLAVGLVERVRHVKTPCERSGCATSAGCAHWLVWRHSAPHCETGQV